MIIHNIPQGSSEWLAIRKGKLTASNAQAIGNGGKGLETLVWETMSALFSSSSEEGYTNKDMERGKELEALAVAMYELENSQKTETVGFIQLDDHVGCSPDRLVGEDGLVEIKCPKDTVFLRLLLGKDKPDTKHVWQAQMQMLVSERKWCDLVYFNPNFKKSLLSFKILPDPIMVESLQLGLSKGKAMIEEISLQMSIN